MIQDANGHSEHRPRLLSNYFKERQGLKTAKRKLQRRRDSKEEKTATLAKFAAQERRKIR